MEAVVAASITGLLSLIGVFMTVRASRRASLSQHEEQNGHLIQMLANQEQFHQFNEAMVERMDGIDRKIESVQMTGDVLFGMVADLDTKLAKTRKRTVEKEVV